MPKKNTHILPIKEISSFKSYEMVSCIVLQGTWLEELGFLKGKNVNVKTTKTNKIIISLQN